MRIVKINKVIYDNCYKNVWAYVICEIYLFGLKLYLDDVLGGILGIK